jgi:hypothetical protein
MKLKHAIAAIECGEAGCIDEASFYDLTDPTTTSLISYMRHISPKVIASQQLKSYFHPCIRCKAYWHDAILACL